MHRLETLALTLLLAACHAPGDVGRREVTAEAETRWHRELAALGARLDDLPTDLARTTFLRRYAGALIDIGRPAERDRELLRSIDFDSFEPALFFPLFEQDRLPAACGVTSFFYVKLVQAFGYKAYQYSFGFTEAPYERFVHSVALVEIELDGSRRLIVQDPYLNLTYRTPDGEPLDFYDLLAAVKARRFDRVVVDASTLMTSLLVPDPSLYEEHLSDDCRARLREALRRDDGSLAASIPIARDYTTLMQSPCDDFERDFVDALRRHGLDGPLIQAYTLRAADVVGDDDHEAVQRRIDAILR